MKRLIDSWDYSLCYFYLIVLNVLNNLNENFLVILKIFQVNDIVDRLIAVYYHLSYLQNYLMY
ncbi:unnamed protein product [Schistosoma mattheei]|uniref:Uncharacterized protein n=1 Tax=Schistosoma mattheei TaxID=31246 RepID=A0A183NW30_9TREM|nr:unnamed protein product [Schistosoma mattheei]